MALKLKYTDEHGILHIDMSPRPESPNQPKDGPTDPKFDTINARFGQYDLFGGKYEGGYDQSGGSLFRSRYNSIEEELANTPYAFERTQPVVDITIDRFVSDIEDDRYFDRSYGLFGPEVEVKSETPAFTVTQLIHAQDRYFDLSSRGKSAPGTGEAFEVLNKEKTLPSVPTAKRRRDKSFAIIADTPVSRPSSPRSLPIEIRPGRVSPFKGRGFREETSRHNTPKTSTNNSRANSPPRRRTHSLSRIDKMAQTATLPPPILLPRPHSPRNFLKENIEEVRELSEFNREKNEAEAEKRRIEEEEAILKEMGLLDKNKSKTNSRTTSRSNSPIKIKLRSRSNSPIAILHYENIPTDSREFIYPENEMASSQVTHRSRLRSVSRSQPQSNNGSPKSKIPKRQNSVSPARSRPAFISRRPYENTLNKNQRFISNSTSSIHETIRIGSQVHDKRPMSRSTQFLDITTSVRGKPPIFPGRTGPPPSNRSINAKRLSPIEGTPSKSPIDNTKPGSAKTTKPTPIPRKTIKTAGNTPATSKFNSKQPSRTGSRDPSPEKRKTTARTATAKSTTNTQNKPLSRVASTKSATKPAVPNKIEPKKPINRTNSVKSLTRTPSTKTLNEKPPILKKRDSKKDLTEKSKSSTKLNEVGKKNDDKNTRKSARTKSLVKKGSKDEQTNTDEDVKKQDNETQYDKSKINNDLVLLSKKSVVSMTTAAITAQPLEVVTTVTNQLPAALEKAREKGMFERLSSKDSLVPKEEEKSGATESTTKDNVEDKMEKDDKKPPKPVKNHEKPTLFSDDNIKLKLLQPPYNNPQVERAKQKIDSILLEPEISPENILTPVKTPIKPKEIVQGLAEKTTNEIKEIKTDVVDKVKETKDQIGKETEKIAEEIRSEATKIVDSIITPVEEPKEVSEKPKEVIKENIEPIITVVNEKQKNGPQKADITEKVTETLVKGEPEVDVQSSNLSTPGVEKMAVQNKMADGNASDRSSHSNGGFPQSTSTTPKPPARAHRQPKEESPPAADPEAPHEKNEQAKPNICSRLMGKCKAKCCPCCMKAEDDEAETRDVEGSEKKSGWKNLNCCKKTPDEDVERAAGKAATIEFESETKRKRKLRDVLCACCRQRRVSDVTPHHAELTSPVKSSDVVTETGCCGKKKEIERRDSILSDTPNTCCNNRLCRWLRGACRRQSEQSSSRRTSLFSKNKSLSPTLPPEDTRTKLDPALIEHTSVMRGAIPVLPIALAYFCLVCNVLVAGLGTILSGMFCLCFGIPRFGPHDGAKHRMGALVINLLVGCGQVFTVLFCLVGWGWSIWWGVIMVKTARKYRKLKAEAAVEEAEAPPVTANNHTRA